MADLYPIIIKGFSTAFGHQSRFVFLRQIGLHLMQPAHGFCPSLIRMIPTAQQRRFQTLQRKRVRMVASIFEATATDTTLIMMPTRMMMMDMSTHTGIDMVMHRYVGGSRVSAYSGISGIASPASRAFTNPPRKLVNGPISWPTLPCSSAAMYSARLSKGTIVQG